ncbi:Gfo/Idh/MocA family protein [Microbacterium karelineae]|uniref:Gfo/Idh/MocA family protein n=1 Tax=Microbacterium karelineae TaxID=2654283 RepID=UPI0012E9B9E0|nr:Gfo/Idh/MocA family oxidoreductase [Microbacterium karelineae]
MPHGVGILGAGPGVSALHLPTLARLDGMFAVVHIADASGERAPDLAARIGARTSRGSAEVLADEDVDVVVLCAPPATHAALARAAIRAGKHVLCEKPLATDAEDVRAIVDEAREAGLALVVGTNHLHDTAWHRALRAMVTEDGAVKGIGLTLALPPNDRYHALVSEPGPASARRGGPDLADPRIAAGVVRQLATGLVMHDLPAIRDLAPDFEGLDDARALPPIGCALGFRASGIPVRVTAAMLPGGADALWRMTIDMPGDRLTIDHPPAFAHAGSTVVSVATADGRTTVFRRDPDDGYVGEWRALAAMLEGREEPQYDEMAADALYAIELADAAADLVRAGGIR